MAQVPQRRSNLLAQSTSRSTLPPDQLHGLLKLRGELGLTRRLKDESPTLQSENARLRSASKQLEHQSMTRGKPGIALTALIVTGMLPVASQGIFYDHFHHF